MRASQRGSRPQRAVRAERKSRRQCSSAQSPESKRAAHAPRKRVRRENTASATPNLLSNRSLIRMGSRRRRIATETWEAGKQSSRRRTTLDSSRVAERWDTDRDLPSYDSLNRERASLESRHRDRSVRGRAVDIAAVRRDIVEWLRRRGLRATWRLGSRR